MLDPSDLLAVARLLSDVSVRPPPTDSHLRRAASTAYYALFHKILGAAAQRFMGPGQEQSGGYTLVYRGFEHKQMSQFCKKLDVQTLSATLIFNLGKTAVSQDMRDFTSLFVDLQEVRHLADYHPNIPIEPSHVSSAIASAEYAIAAFDRAPG